MHGIPLRGKRVVVQRYGETNRDLQATLESEGAEVIEIVTYRWGLPEDTTPLLRLIDALGRDEIDLVAFTTHRRRATFSPSRNTTAKRRRSSKVLAERSSLRSARCARHASSTPRAFCHPRLMVENDQEPKPVLDQMVDFCLALRRHRVMVNQASHTKFPTLLNDSGGRSHFGSQPINFKLIKVVADLLTVLSQALSRKHWPSGAGKKNSASARETDSCSSC